MVCFISGVEAPTRMLCSGVDMNLSALRLSCTRYLGEGQTGMCIQEIQIPSGFVADLASTGNIAGLKRMEQRGSDVVAYFDQVKRRLTVE